MSEVSAKVKSLPLAQAGTFGNDLNRSFQLAIVLIIALNAMDAVGDVIAVSVAVVFFGNLVFGWGERVSARRKADGKQSHEWFGC